MELSGKRIIVTGCASGMGAATVRAYVNAAAQGGRGRGRHQFRIHLRPAGRAGGRRLFRVQGRGACLDSHGGRNLGADGVRVNAVLPAIRTPMFQASWDRATDEGRTEKFWRNSHSIALGQDYGDPDRDLGPVMVFLASDAPRFVTGQLIAVDGGQGNVR